MRLAHLADFHLGYRGMHPAREGDGIEALRRAIDGVIAARPDAVVIAGDLFHTVRPGNGAVRAMFAACQRLRQALPEAPIVAIEGNHDRPKSRETGTILPLYTEAGITIMAGEVGQLEVGDLSITGVPDGALTAPGAEQWFRPSGRARYHVLVLHGEVDGVVQATTPAALDVAGWDYIALGHYHVTTKIAPRVWYAGALDWLSPNPWGELADEARHGLASKGWLEVDLDTGDVTRHAIDPARRVIDGQPVHADGLGGIELTAAIVERLDAVPGGLTDAVVRLVVHDVHPLAKREIDYDAIRMRRAQTLQLRLDLRRPDRGVTVSTLGDAARRGRPLPELLAEYLRRRPLPPGLDAERLVTQGQALLQSLDEEP